MRLDRILNHQLSGSWLFIMHWNHRLTGPCVYYRCIDNHERLRDLVINNDLARYALVSLSYAIWAYWWQRSGYRLCKQRGNRARCTGDYCLDLQLACKGRLANLDYSAIDGESKEHDTEFEGGPIQRLSMVVFKCISVEEDEKDRISWIPYWKFRIYNEKNWNKEKMYESRGRKAVKIAAKLVSKYKSM